MTKEQLDNMPPLELDYRMYAPSEVKLLIEQQTAELRAEVEIWKRESYLMAAHQSIDTHQRWMNENAELRAELEKFSSVLYNYDRDDSLTEIWEVADRLQVLSRNNNV